MARVKKEATGNEIPQMGRARTSGQRDSGFKSDLRSIRVNLTAKDKKLVLSSPYVGENITPVVAAYVENGYKFSVSMDADTATFIVTLTYFNESSVAHKHCLQGRGKTLELAWAALRYKDIDLLGGDWEASVGGDDTDGLG